MNLNYFDWLLIVIIAWSTCAAFIRGLVLELFALGGLIAGILLASWNYPALAAILERFITTKTVANVVAFVCSKEGGYIHGQTIALDGGWSTTKYLVPEALMAERVAPNPSKQPA